MGGPYPLGKLPMRDLEALLSKVISTDERVVVGPGVGQDAAVLDFGDRFLVAKTDPVTFTTDRIGWYAVHVNANDVACMGARPRWFMATALLPEGSADRAMAESIFDQMLEACGSLNVSAVGGHTEITRGIDRPILVGTMLGEAERDRLVTGAGAHPGEAVMLAGQVPIEATAILATEFAHRLAGVVEAEALERAKRALDDPGISVVRAAQAAGPVSAMHDPTEGGLATGLWELATASDVSLEVDWDRIPFLPEGLAVCEALGADPLSSIASGALLFTTSDPEGALTRLNAAGIPAAQIGTVLDDKGPAVGMLRVDRVRPLELPERDEIARLFDEGG